MKLRPPKFRFVLREEPLPYGHKPQLANPESIYDFYRQVISTDENFEPQKEHLIVILLDSRLHAIGYNVVSVGTVNECAAHPREVLRPVILGAGAAFVILHNHPSGDPSPSKADEAVTRRIVEAANIFQLRFVDHVVCGTPSPGRQSYFSFRESGLIP